MPLLAPTLKSEGAYAPPQYMAPAPLSQCREALEDTAFEAKATLSEAKAQVNIVCPRTVRLQGQGQSSKSASLLIDSPIVPGSELQLPVVTDRGNASRNKDIVAPLRHSA